jgi:hypothetical protein
MKKYLFGYLFVRLAKVLAIVLLLAAISWAVKYYLEASLQAQQVRYRPSVELKQRVRDLQSEWSHCQAQVNELNGIPENSTAAIAPSFPERLETQDDLNELMSKINALGVGRDALKGIVVGKLEGFLSQIEGKLRSYAAQIAGENKALAPLPKSGVQSAPSPAPATLVQTVEPASLYERMPEREVESRLKELGQVREFLEALLVDAENPESRTAIGGSVAELAELEKLLPVQLVEIAPAPVSTLPAQRAALIEKPPLAPPLRAQKAADRIYKCRMVVRESLLTSWKLDKILDEAEGLAVQENTRCQSAALALRGIWMSAGFRMGTAMAAGILAAFLVMVFADLLQTFFDTATNTGILVESRVSDPQKREAP